MGDGPSPIPASSGVPVTVPPPAEVRSEGLMTGSGNWAVAVGGFLAVAALGLLFRGRGRTRVGEEVAVRPRLTELLLGRFDAVAPRTPLPPALAGGRFNPFTALRASGATAALATAAGCSSGSTPPPPDRRPAQVSQDAGSPSANPAVSLPQNPNPPGACQNIREMPGVVDQQQRQLGIDDGGLLYVRVNNSWVPQNPLRTACPATPPGGTPAAPTPPASPPAGQGSGQGTTPAPQPGRRRSSGHGSPQPRQQHIDNPVGRRGTAY